MLSEATRRIGMDKTLAEIKNNTRGLSLVEAYELGFNNASPTAEPCFCKPLSNHAHVHILGDVYVKVPTTKPSSKQGEPEAGQ